MATNNPYMNAPPELVARYLEAAQKQQQAQNYMNLPGGQAQMVGGRYIPPNLGDALVKSLGLYQGNKMMGELPQDFAQIQGMQNQFIQQQEAEQRAREEQDRLKQAQAFGFGLESPQATGGGPELFADRPSASPSVLPGTTAEQSQAIFQAVGGTKYGELLAKGLADQHKFNLKAESADMKAATKDTSPWGDNVLAMGKPQGDTMFVRDEATGAVRVEPVPGGKEDLARREAEDKKVKAFEGQIQQADVVLQEIDKALNILTTGTDLGGYLETGLGGSIMRNIPGTEARDIEDSYDTLRAAIAFNTLQEMRESSPTGGALGSVTERELDLLASTLGKLDVSSSKEVQLRTLNRVREIFNDIKSRKVSDFIPKQSDGQAGPVAGGQAGRPDLSAIWGD